MSEYDDDQPREPSFEQKMQGLLREEPFVPFAVVMTSGDRYEVTNPFALAIGQTSVTIYPPRSSSVMLRKSQIVSVEMPEPAI